MATKSSKQAHGASGKTDLLLFDPDNLVMVEDKESPLYDERVHLPLNEELVLNIMALGVIEPVVVSKNTETGATEVVVGRQRVKCAREANRRLKEIGRPPIKVPATSKRASDSVLMGVMVSENEQRTADSPVGRAQKMARMQERGTSDEDLALYFGVSPQTVKYHLSLLDCTEAVRKAVDSGKIGVNHAKALSKLDPAEQRTKVDELIAAGEGVTGHEKSKRQKAVVAKKPSMRGKKEIKAMIAETRSKAWKAALTWVLGEEAEEDAE